MLSLVQKKCPCLISGALLGAQEPAVLHGIRGDICRAARGYIGPWLPALAAVGHSPKGPQAGTLCLQHWQSLIPPTAHLSPSGKGGFVQLWGKPPQPVPQTATPQQWMVWAE